MKLIATLITLTALATPAFAQTNTEALTFNGAHVFLPMKGTNTTAGYAKINNPTAKEVSISVVKAEPFKAAELHETAAKDGKMTMKKIESLKIPAKGSAQLAFGGNHIMLFDATKELKANDTVQITINVDGKPVVVPFKAIPRMTGPGNAGGGHHH